MGTNTTKKTRVENLISIISRDLNVGLAPISNEPIWAWADRNVWLGADVTSEPGPWRTDFTPYNKGVMEAIQNPRVEKVVIMKAARLGCTYSAVLNVIGWHIQNDPCPIFLVYPTAENAKKFSKKNLDTFIRDCKPIRGLVAEKRSRDTENTIFLKMFPGGSLTLVGANSPNAMRVDTAKIAIIDEADGEIEIREGDYVTLAENRTLTYVGRGRKVIILSTPKIKGQSVIEAQFQHSTMQYFQLPCPSCGEMQKLDWQMVNHDTATHTCYACGCMHTEKEWKHNWGETGMWVEENPDGEYPGFHLSALYSPFLSWEFIITKWREAVRESNAGNNEKLQAFINTYLGETWEVRGEQVDEVGLMKRREVYFMDNAMNADPCLIPDGVCALTIGVDVQNNRLEYEVVGWGPGRESWGIEYGILPGDPRVPGSAVWGLLDNVIRSAYRYENGVPVPVVCTCVDYGGGEGAPDQTAAYCKARMAWNVWPIRGVSGFGKLFVDLKQTFRTKVASATGFNLGVDTGKDELAARLRVEDPGPGYCRFPRGGMSDALGVYERVRGYDERYFAGLASEKKVSVKLTTKEGFQRGHRYEWQLQPGARNEPLDARNYASAALIISRVDLDGIAEQAPWVRDLPEEPIRSQPPRAVTPMTIGNRINTQLNANRYTAV